MNDQPKRKLEIEKAKRIWAAMDKLAEQITKEWPEGVSAVDAIKEQRRE